MSRSRSLAGRAGETGFTAKALKQMAELEPERFEFNEQTGELFVLQAESADFWRMLIENEQELDGLLCGRIGA